MTNNHQAWIRRRLGEISESGLFSDTQRSAARAAFLELERLIVAIDRYGTHLSSCKYTMGGDRCTCGFIAEGRGCTEEPGNG